MDACHAASSTEKTLLGRFRRQTPLDNLEAWDI